MTTIYNNIPRRTTDTPTDPTIKFFDTFYKVPVELNGTSLTAVKGFFETRGYKSEAAESVAIIILTQAKKDNINPFKIIDTLKGFDNVEISALVGEILNYNRFKTSSLGITRPETPADEIHRNVLL